MSKRDLAFRSWFAGFVAGEAYFRIHKCRGGDYFSCHFGVHMRMDERALLNGLMKRTGAGTLSFHGETIGKGGLRSNPGVRWVVQSREDCKRIAELLDGIPIYGKKQREYDLWREALRAWCTQERGSRWHGPGSKDTMRRFYEEMKRLRVFDLADAMNAPNPFEVRHG